MDKNGKKVTVGSVVPAIIIVIFIFMLPKDMDFLNRDNPEGLITWEKVEKKMNWGVLLLLGGGYTLSNGCSKSGLSGKLTLRAELCETDKKLIFFYKICIFLHFCDPHVVNDKP